MHSMALAEDRDKIVVGVDTHKYVHVAVAINSLGVYQDDLTVASDAGGYHRLEQWARLLGDVQTFGVEGTNSYGRGLTSYLLSHNQRVIEVVRPDRRARRLNGKSDILDAEAAARSVLAGASRARAKSGDGLVEAIREIKATRDGARKARTAAITSLRNLLLNVPQALRDQLESLAIGALVERCAGFRVTAVDSPTSAAKFSLRALARRYQFLTEEMVAQGKLLDALTREVAPRLREGYCIGADSAAALLVAFGDNAERVCSEAAFAKLCGVAPQPASSGMTTRHRLSRGGNRQANAALHHVVVVRMHHDARTRDYVVKRTKEGLSKKEIMRCLKRYVAREVYSRVREDLVTESGDDRDIRPLDI